MDFDLTVIPAGGIEQAILQIRGLRVLWLCRFGYALWGDDKGTKPNGQTQQGPISSRFHVSIDSGRKTGVVTNCDHLFRLRFSPVLPYVFTGHGVLMLANILNSGTSGPG